MATQETSTESTSNSEEAGSGTSKQSTTKKSTAKKTGTKKSAPRKKAPASADRSGNGAPRASAGKKKTVSQIASQAARQLLELTGREAEGVTGLERTDDGWKVRVEVLEVRRIPETTDVLALYEVEVDTDGDMVGYHRVRRYTRGTPGEE